MLPATKEIGDVRHAGKFGCRHNFSDYHPPGVISLRKGLFSFVQSFSFSNFSAEK